MSGKSHSPDQLQIINIIRTNNATIEVIIEAPGFNNSLAGNLNCPNAEKADYVTPVATWYKKYLKDGLSHKGYHHSEMINADKIDSN